MTDYRDMKSDSVARLILETVKEDSKEKRRESKARRSAGQTFSLSEKTGWPELRREHVADRHRVSSQLSLREGQTAASESTEGGRTGRSPLRLLRSGETGA